MFSAVDLCNRALDACRAASITALTDGTLSAQLCARHLPWARRTVLQLYPWNAALRDAGLAALVEPPAFGFAYKYSLPADMVRIWTVQASQWVRQGQVILANAGAPLQIRYVADIDVADMDPLLADVTALRLALEIAPRLTESSGVEERLQRQYELRVREARLVHAQETAAQQFSSGESWLAARE